MECSKEFLNEKLFKLLALAATIIHWEVATIFVLYISCIMCNNGGYGERDELCALYYIIPVLLWSVQGFFSLNFFLYFSSFLLQFCAGKTKCEANLFFEMVGFSREGKIQYNLRVIKKLCKNTFKYLCNKFHRFRVV